MLTFAVVTLFIFSSAIIFGSLTALILALSIDPMDTSSWISAVNDPQVVTHPPVDRPFALVWRDTIHLTGSCVGGTSGDRRLEFHRDRTDLRFVRPQWP